MSLRLQARSNTNLNDRSNMKNGFKFEEKSLIDSDDNGAQNYYNFISQQKEKNINNSNHESNYLYEIVPYKPKK
jgi:hypothetical protein